MPGTRRSNGNLDTTYKFGYPFNLTPPSACLLLCDCSFICNYLVLIALFSFLCSCSRSLPSLWGWSHTGSSRTWCTPEYVAAYLDSYGCWGCYIKQKLWFWLCSIMIYYLLSKVILSDNVKKYQFKICKIKLPALETDQ